MIKTLAKSIREYKKESILSCVLIVIEVIMEVIIPLIMAFLLDEGIHKGNKTVIWQSSFLLLIVAIISLVCGTIASLLSAKASCGFAKNLRKDMYYKVQDYSFSNIDKFSSSSIVTRLTTDVSYVQMAYQMIIRTALRAPFMLLFSLIMAFYINSKVALIFLVVMPFLAIALFIISSKAHPIFREVFKTYDDLNTVVQENVRGIRVVKSYVKEDYEKEKFSKISQKIFTKFSKAEKIVAYNAPVMQLSMYTCILLISWFGSKLIVGGSLTTGELTSLFSYTGAILTSLMMCSMIYVMCIISWTSAQRIVEILKETPDLTNPTNPVQKVLDGRIEFNNVTFSYAKDDEKLSLKNVSFKINSGEVIGIIGGTGSSKSTLVSLINRLYDVTKGSVSVGGVDVKDYDLASLRDGVSVVLQKNVLFSGTIIENLRWGNKNASLKDIKNVCKIACASEFIENLPNKYEYVLDQGGTNVSGGQKQRLCIARALLKEPKILILDDSTSAVDTATDAKIMDGLSKYLPNVTKIIIAQRISSVENADRVIVMDKGKINDIGTPEELLKKNKIYQEVYNSQKKGANNNEK